MNLVRKVIHFLFPSFCEICQKPLEDLEVLVCNSCYFKLPFLKNYCQKCGNVDLTYSEVSYCGKCLSLKFYFDKFIAGFKYEKPISNWILEAKFKENFLLAYQLGRLLNKTLSLKVPSVDVVIPLPLSKGRLKKRGYNQSFLIAYGFSGKKPELNLLFKTKETQPQMELSYKERVENIKDAFLALRDKVEGKRILLIDDVMTTGATLNEASKALKKAGAKEVYGCVVARA
ncbi:MAG: ComF family protein [Thermodesulfobacterium sp.]|nr:ComF family protein [Thermodesulfobacterium sp.]